MKMLVKGYCEGENMITCGYKVVEWVDVWRVLHHIIFTSIHRKTCGSSLQVYRDLLLKFERLCTASGSTCECSFRCGFAERSGNCACDLVSIMSVTNVLC